MSEQGNLSLPGGELTLVDRVAEREAWELRRGDEPVGLVERSPRRTRVSGQGVHWSVVRARRRFGGRLVFRPPGSLVASAAYQSTPLRRGGTLVVSEQRAFALRPPGVFGKSWRLSGEDGAEFVQARFSGAGQWLLDLDAEAAREPAALLIVLATCYLIVADSQAPQS
jgi:hypothetical protein